jgi:hypothetical protein
MFKKLLYAYALCTSFITIAADNVVLVTIDGLRWQEVFNGAQLSMIKNDKFVSNSSQLEHDFWHQDVTVRREKLMPFFWQSIVTQGAVIGDRNNNSNMSVANDWYFSYPGYSEILTGFADPKIDSNQKFNNPNITFLEWLNAQKEYKNKVASFASWDVFPYIINTDRSKLAVNAGFTKSNETDNYSQLLNTLQDEIPSPWHNVRLDSFTYRFAKHNLLKNKPKVTYIALGETDDFAHDGHYDQYLYAAKRTDQYLADLWQTIQTTEGYKNNTVMLIVTDHGRGATAADWQHHASEQATTGYLASLKDFKKGIIGSEQIWLAAIGPDINPSGITPTPYEVKQDQVAATVLTILGQDAKKFSSVAGKPISFILKKYQQHASL